MSTQFRRFILVISILVMSLSSCDRILENIGIKAVTGEALKIFCESVVLTGSAIIPNSSTSDIAIGVHYSLSEGMIPDNSIEVKALLFDKSYAFSLDIDRLKPGTKYYYRTFVKEADIYFFGDIKSFTTARIPTIKLSTESVSFDFMEHVGSFDVITEDFVSGYKMSASTTATWITDVKISGTTVSYRVSRYEDDNGIGERTGDINVLYGDIRATFYVYQTLTALRFFSYSEETDYASKSLYNPCIIVNPLDGFSLTAKSNEPWITDVKVNDLTVFYNVAENNSGASRTGKVMVTYGDIAKEFSITQRPLQNINGHEFVDLGLSVKWATSNLGASTPDGHGIWCQWAGQDVKDAGDVLNWNNCPYHTGSAELSGWTKYIPLNQSSYWSGSGVPDNKTLLDSSDDIAHLRWGGTWRMPTDTEWTELRQNCSWTWTKMNNTDGYMVKSEKLGYTDKWIFLPAARFNGGHNTIVGSSGYYWSSSLHTGNPSKAYSVDFDSRYIRRIGHDRFCGQSVRPVAE